MSDFAERFGYRPASVELAETDMPSSLKSGLWDILSVHYFAKIHDKHSSWGGAYSSGFKKLTGSIWFQFYREPMDARPDYAGDALKLIRSRFFSANFYQVYQFVEFIVSQPTASGTSSKGVHEGINFVLEREKAAFRLLDGLLIKLNNEHELSEISEAIGSAHEPIGEHVRLAAKHYSSLENPDFRNSIKESISAVEAAVSFVVGKKTHGISKPLKTIADKYEIHPSLRDGFGKIYAWTSDDSGIRHRLLEKSNLTQDDARFMLIACSAFANYLTALKVRYGEVEVDQ